jgi:hypothetical protein
MSGKLIIEMFGSENLGNPNYDNFTPFDVLTNEIVIGWLIYFPLKVNLKVYLELNRCNRK